MSDKIQILCYGDSNTWGCIGHWEEWDRPSERYAPECRWPCVLQNDLGNKYNVIAEGLGGRTTIYDVPGEEWKNGEPYLIPCLNSHRPLDLVIIMLGTNDLQYKKDMTQQDLSIGISRLVDIVQQNRKAGRGFQSPKILIIAPIEVQPADPNGRILIYPRFRGDIGRNLSLKFPEVYEAVAKDKNCFFINAQDYATPGPADGIHFDPDSHIRLGHGVAKYIRENIFN